MTTNELRAAAQRAIDSLDPLGLYPDVREDLRAALTAITNEAAAQAVPPGLEYPHSSEGTIRCTCDEYPHAQGCGSTIGQRGFEAGYRNAMETIATQPVQAQGEAEPVTVPADYLQGHADGLEWAALVVEAEDPRTGDWLHDDRNDLAEAIRRGPDMPPAAPAVDRGLSEAQVEEALADACIEADIPDSKFQSLAIALRAALAASAPSQAEPVTAGEVPASVRIALENLDSMESLGPTTEAVIDAVQRWYLASPAPARGAAPSQAGSCQASGEAATMHEALVAIIRAADAAKEPCGNDPESPAAIRNGAFATIAQMAAQGLGMVRGPSLATSPPAGRTLTVLRQARRSLEDAGGMWIKPGDIERRLRAIEAIDAILAASSTTAGERG